MTEISLEKTTIVNLVRFKLVSLQSEIEKILAKWNEELVQTFLQKAKNGIYEEAENDAIDLHQLIKEEQEMQSLLERIGVLK